MKNTKWLLLLHNRTVLLERRPSIGLWGGLWTFPEARAVMDVADYCRRHFGCEVCASRKIKPVEHGFTHFRLRVSPMLCEIGSVTPRAESAGRLWMDIEEAQGAAVPAPVKKLLNWLASARSRQETSDAWSVDATK